MTAAQVSSSADFAMLVEGLEPFQLRVLSFEGHEEMNGLYRFDVRFWLEGDDGDVEDYVLHNGARLMLEPNGASGIEGIVTEVEMDHAHAQGGMVGRLRIQPRMARLCVPRQSRVFQGKTVVEIVCAVLDSHRVAYDRNKLSKAYPVRDYCVQYQETDYELVTRLLAEEGIMFFLLQPALGLADPVGANGPNATELLVLVDDAEDYWEMLGGVQLPYSARRETTLNPWGIWVDTFERRRKVGPESLYIRAYTYMNPAFAKPFSSWDEADMGGAVRWDRQIFEHHAEYELPDVLRNVAPSQLQQHRASLDVATGRTNCRLVTPGRVFKLDGHALPHLDGRYVPISVHHEGYGSWSRPKDKDTYVATFECVPASVPFRPPRPEKRPREVLLTGVVVGPQGQDQEIHTDELGRVRVRLHWQDPFSDASQSTCFLRVATPWAGIGFGMQWTPRVGTEVLVGFIGGDLDNPVVVGCLYNKAQPPPFSGPSAGRKSGVVSRSTPGGTSYNEISFDDTLGAEVLQITAARDLKTHVEHDRKCEVKNDDSLQVHGASAITIDKDLRESVGGVHNLRVEKDDYHFVRGNRTEVTWGDVDLTMEKNVSAHVFGAEKRTVEKDSEVTIGGHSTVRASGGLTTIVAGSSPTLHELHVDGTSQTAVSGSYLVDAGAEIDLTCGKSRIRLLPDSIELIAPEIRFKGPAIQLVLREGEIDLRARDLVLVKADKTLMRTRGARVALGKDARIEGDKIKLNCESEDDDDLFPDDKGVATHIELKDQRGRPLAHRHYTVLSGGEPVSGGILGKDGTDDAVLSEGDQIVFDQLPGARSA